MQSESPEGSEKAGIYYATADDGLRLPVVDVTHPTFAIRISDSELERMLQEHMREVERRGRTPAFIQNAILGLMMRRSRLMRGISGAQGGFLTGMNTYIMKIGPRNMDRSYASNIDRQISASLPGLSVRLRLQNCAHLLAEGIIATVGARRNGQSEKASERPAVPLYLLNIGGGPAIDSLNALIIIRKRQPELPAGRPIAIYSLDLDESGPHFGERALAALQSEGAPLQGLDLRFEHVKYDWTDTSPLRSLLNSWTGDRIVAASSEGALFEYGTDEIITANLQALHDGTPPNAIVAGSVTRADTTGRLLNGASRAALQMRGIEAFTELARRAGWAVTECLTRPSGHDVRLKKG